MADKKGGGSLPPQSGTQQKGRPQPGGADAVPVNVKPGFKGGGSGKGGGGGKK